MSSGFSKFGRIAGLLLALVSPALTLGVAFPTEAAASGKRVVEGAIVRFECGDNCYLTIRDASGKERTGLCAAPQCAPWNDVAEMPKSFEGRRVSVSVGRGKQFDGAGNVMGVTDAFQRIEFRK